MIAPPLATVLTALPVALLVIVVGWRCAPRPHPRRPAPAARSTATPIIALVSGILGVALMVGPLPAAAALTMVPVAQRWQHVRHLARRRRAVERAYPDAIEMLVLAVRAGALPSAAVQSALPHLPLAVRPAFAAVQQRVATGERFADALGALATHLGLTARPLVDSLAAADRYGLPLAPVLDRLADDARQHRRRAAEARARQLPVRLSLPLVLCTLPSFVLLAIVPLLIGALSSLSS